MYPTISPMARLSKRMASFYENNAKPSLEIESDCALNQSAATSLDSFNAAIALSILCRSPVRGLRSEEHTSELQSLMRISYAVFCLKKTKKRLVKHKQTLSTEHSNKRLK